jgi:hypothetical protein
MNAEASYSSSFSDGNCLSTGALRQYIDGTLPRKNLHLVEKHLLDCEFCSHVLEDMDVSEEAMPDIAGIARNVNARIAELVGSAPQPAFWTRYATYFKIGGAALLLTGGAAWYHFQNGSAESKVEKTVLPPVSPLSTTPPGDVPSSQTTAPGKASVEDEFSSHKTNAPSPDAAVKNTVSASPNTEASPKTESSPEAPKEVSPAEVAVVPVSKKEEAAAEVSAEKENVSNLQIVTVKILQKMTKTAGSSRKPAKKGQLAAPTDKNASYSMEDMPQFPGGDEMMEEYLVAHFQNPVKDKRVLTGKAVGVMFTVSARGKISDVEITHSIGPELDVEVLRLISSMPQWAQGKHLSGDITCVLALTVR